MAWGSTVGMTPWLLTALVFVILWIFWRALNFVLDLIAYGLETSPAPYGAPLLDTAHDVGSWKRSEGTGNGALAISCLCRKGAWNPECPVHGRRT